MTLTRRPTLCSGLPGYARFLIGQSNYDSRIKTDGRLMYWAELVLQLKQTINLHYYTLNSLSLFRLAESVTWIFESAPVTSSSCRLHNNHVRDTQGHGWSCHLWPRCMISKGNHAKYARLVTSPQLRNINMTSIFFGPCRDIAKAHSIIVYNDLAKENIYITRGFDCHEQNVCTKWANYIQPRLAPLHQPTSSKSRKKQTINWL